MMLGKRLMRDIRQAEQLLERARRLQAEAHDIGQAFRELGLVDLVMTWQDAVEAAERIAQASVVFMEKKLEDCGLQEMLVKKHWWEEQVTRGKHVRWTARGSVYCDGREVA